MGISTALWQTRIGGLALDVVFIVMFDRSGNGTTDAGLPETMAAPYDGDDIGMTAFDSRGTALWARRPGGPDSDVSRSIALDRTGNAMYPDLYMGMPSWMAMKSRQARCRNTLPALGYSQTRVLI